MPTAETSLALAERRVVEVEERLTRQIATIARSAGLGQDTSLAENILSELEQSLDLARDHRDRLQEQADS